ncbi:tRNA epoxyqueuosine(34) reductase QueG [Thalassoroseus pseudoceratinae]|uniref:tRNA epoxyqueuosine(34) reductase QueG n=1 Tax=Thalassoroseus pseudoceratinae TaxID=2713176 RepID=UPI00198211A8|nr:tRNA epoxyqueuosine(34) reductase QueG [Thalassoroseus pseudoceratinae]
MSVTSDNIKTEANRLGFGLVGIAPAVTPTGFSRLTEWIAAGLAGEMSYIERRRDAYSHPKYVLDGVRSVIMLGMHYRTEDPTSSETGTARVSRYAWGTEDYHNVVKRRLRELANFIHAGAPDCTTRVVVDTAPLLERDFARLAGLGWFGKNTMLINKHAGSFFFLGALLTDLELDSDAPHESTHCGTCTRCLDACPTDAFPEPGVLDAKRCISYLTIELRGPIPRHLRPGLRNWVFGCDVCQDVCPWNRKAPRSDEPSFQPNSTVTPADAAEWLTLDDEAFRQRFRKTPLARPKRAGLLRNAAIVLGNTHDQQYVPVLIAALSDAEPLIRGAAAWALGEIGGEAATQALQTRTLVENNADTQAELTAALERF